MNSSDRSVYKENDKVELLEEFIRVDFDGDGVVELRHVKRVGHVILENIEVQHSEFITWSPIRVSHKKVGRSIADQTIDLQKIRTQIARSALDSLAQQLTPRVGVDKNKLEDDGFDSLLDNDIGGVVEFDGRPGDALLPLVTPDMTGPAFQMLEYWDQEGEQRTGVTRLGQGLDPKALTKTASGMGMLQSAGLKRVDLIVDFLRDALEIVLQRCLDLIISHQDHPRFLKINNEWQPIDPRMWSDEMSVKVHVGGITTKEQEIQNLGIIAQKQEQVLLQAGESNPLVSMKHLRTTYAELVEAMGYKNADKYFADVPEDYEPPQPEPQQDPKVIEVQAKSQIEQQKTQNEQQNKAQQLENDLTIALRRIHGELMLKEQQLVAELDLKKRQIGVELELKAYAAKNQQQISSNISSDVHVGGDPG
ncbi:MAG: hypothetical protein AAF228_12680 [Pseudomonadota bacterium]